MSEKIKVIGSSSNKWTPLQDGHFFEKHLKNNLSKLTERDKKNYIRHTVEILSRSINPKEPKNNNNLSSTGIVIGYIQSGKTASMEGLISLAKDNGFQIVILLSGVVSNLTNQTVERIFQSIRGSGWNQIRAETPSDIDEEYLGSEIINCLNSFVEDPDDFKRNETSLIIQMKRKERINKMTEMFENINKKYPLFSKVPCLIIDDEGDQHSLTSQQPRGTINEIQYTIKRGDTLESICEEHIVTEDELIRLNTNDENQELILNEGSVLTLEPAESVIHRALKNLRKAIPFHTFLSYTATPQAQLIVPVFDFLSPKFAIILEPGEDYTGVNYFFNNEKSKTAQQNIFKYTRVIPNEEIIQFSEEDIIPETLKTALMEFIIGVAIGIANDEDTAGGKNRTMMITPSSTTSKHKQYVASIKAIKENWVEVLNDKNDDTETLYQKFNKIYSNEIEPNYSGKLSKFNEFKGFIIKALRITKTQEINARGTKKIPNVNWDEYAKILVGGIGLERGYTVEGLTVTYMSRPTSGQQDTAQQRARFAGYRKKYEDFVKIYLTSDLQDFYNTYSLAEKYLNNSIKEFQDKNSEDLNQWSRTFMARSGTTLTRRNMSDKTLHRYAVRGIKQDLCHELSPEQQKVNLDLYSYIKTIANIEIGKISQRKDTERRHSCLITENYQLKTGLEEILSKIEYHYKESAYFADANNLIRNYLDSSETELELKVILMNISKEESERNITKKMQETRKLNIHIGRSQANGFCGDNLIHYDYLVNKSDDAKPSETPTLQVYKFDKILDELDETYIQNDVVYFCLKLPKTIHQDSSLIRIE